MSTRQSRIVAVPRQATRSSAEAHNGAQPVEYSSHLLLTVEQAAQKLNVGRSTLYGLLQSGRLKSVTVGRLRRVPAAALSEFVESLRDGCEL
jgi:excisionase family DNA binding protein